MPVWVWIFLACALLILETLAYYGARRIYRMPKPWYWSIPGAGFVLLHQAMRPEKRRSTK